MALNMYNIKKWSKMLVGKSILHVNQIEGYYYDKKEIAGYYNDLREKVIKSNLNNYELPLSDLGDGKKIEFPIAIFQYGLGAYDLYLETNDKKYLKIFKKSIDWTINNQTDVGGWKCFFNKQQNNPYSSMGQGEGISLLARAYKEFGDKKYLISIKKAIDLMMKSTEKGGTTLYDKENIFLKEFADEPVVLNGWIFSIYGLYDYLLIFPEDEKVKQFYISTLNTLKQNLKLFNIGFWSNYDIEKKIASPFYHKLHIHLLNVLYDLTQIDEFKKYAIIFEKQSKFKFNKIKACCIKFFQKVREK